MRKTKKTLAILAIVAMVFTMIPMQVFAADATTTYERIGGTTQYDTAAAIAKAGWTTADTAVIAVGATGNSYDALSAGPLAAKKNAPILLTEGNRLTAVTKTTLQDLGVKNAIIVGGTGVIKQAVEDSIKALGISTSRLAGFDASETSVKVAQAIGSFDTLVLAGGRGEDALSISSIASAKGYPILYTNKATNLPDSVASYVSTLSGVTTSYVIGGIGVIQDAEALQLPGTKVRYGGYDAYDTNLAVIQGFDGKDSLSYDKVYVANGQTKVDALAGAPLAAKTDSAIVLTDNTKIPAAGFVSEKLNADSVVIALGGSVVISDSILHQIAYKGSVEVAPKITEVTSPDTKTLVVTFDKSVVDNTAQPAAVSVKKGADTVELEKTAFSADKKTLTITTKADLTPSTELTITVTPVNRDAITATFTTPTYGPTITVTKGADDKTLVVTFDKAVDDTKAVFEVKKGDAAVDVASKSFDTDKKVATLILASNLVTGSTYTVNVTGLTEEPITGSYTVPEGPAPAVETVVTNSLPGIDSKDTVLLGTPALVQAKVVKDGKPVAGATVVFTVSDILGQNGASVTLKGNNVATTDANGIATAVLDTIATYEPTDANHVVSAKYQATVVGSNDKGEGVIKFAALGVNAITVTDDTDLDPSVNSSLSAVSTTYNLAKKPVQYVNSQQVSAANDDNHQVTFSAVPSLTIPGAAGEQNTGDYYQSVNVQSGAYHPYDKIVKTISGIPAGLQYATLNFNQIQISAGSRLTIAAYNANTDSLITGSNYTITGPYDQSNFGYQIPVQGNVPLYIKVTVEAPGQVQTDLNAGFDIKDITGVYSGGTGSEGSTIALPGATINWEKVEAPYSEVKYFNTNRPSGVPAPAEDPGALSALLGADYEPDYVYSYRVPVFPYTGNAVIVGKDANGVEKQYFVWPTINKNGSLSDQQNINILKPVASGETAILTTKAEALNSVGTLTQADNDVTVNSTAVGYTAIRGTLSVPGVGSDVLNALNNKLFTSVQWAPLPDSTTPSTSPDGNYLALVGQTITIKAQLTDANGNPVAKSGIPVAWAYDSGTILGVGSQIGTNVTVVSVDGTTDVNGQATLKVSGSAATSKLDSVTADATEFKTTLKIGDDTITSADLQWVAVGLGYSSVVGTAPVPVYGSAGTVTTPPTAAVGTPWEFGFLLYGKSSDFGDDEIIVKGIDINLALGAGSVGSLNTNTGINGVAAGTSNVAGTQQLIGSLAQPSNEVTFEVDDEIYKNVGEGTPSIYSNLLLPVGWQSSGQNANLILPSGTTIASTEDSTTAYVKVTDNQGNPLVNKDVSYTITGVGQTTTTGTTNAYGVVAIPVANAANSTGQSTISVTVDGSTTALTTTINWVNAQGAELVLANIGLNSTGTNDVLALTFSQPVNPNSIALGQFAVTDDLGAAYAVKSAEVSGNIVYLTLADSNAKLPTNHTYSVNIAPYTATSGANAGIAYNLVDVFGRTIAAGAPLVELTLPSAPEVSLAYDGANLVVKTTNANAGVTGNVVLVFTNPAFTTGNTGYAAVTTDASGDATFDLSGATGFSTVTAYYNGVSAQIFVNK